MNDIGVIEIGRDAFWVILKAGGPILFAGLVVGLLIALFQALTSIQEMTLTFVPKIVVIFFAIILFLPFMMSTVIEFGNHIFDNIVAIG